MTTPASPNSISLNNVNAELGLTTTAAVTMNDTGVRQLAGRLTNTSQISMSDLRGKSRTWTGPNNLNWPLVRPSINKPSVCQAIAISGSGAIMAVSYSDPSGTSTIGVMMYVRTYLQNNAWTYLSTVLPSPSAVGSFGYSIALSYDGGTLVVGAPYVDTMYQSGSGSAGSGQSYSYSRNVPVGAVYVYRNDSVPANTSTSTGNSIWGFRQKIQPTNYTWNSFDSTYFQFGISVAISGFGDVIAFGAPGDNNAKNPYSYLNQSWGSYGAIYVYYSANRTTWAQTQKITGTIFGNEAPLGSYVAMSSDASTIVSTTGLITNLQSAPWAQGGQIQIFNRNSTTAYTYSIKQTIGPDTTDIVSYNQYQFGSYGFTSVAISNDGTTIAVGMSTYGNSLLPGSLGYQVPNGIGRTKIYSYNGSTWSLQQYLSRNINIAGEGNAVALSEDGNRLVVGASSYGANYDYYNSQGYSGIFEAEGAVFLYSRAGSTWTFVKRIDPPAGSVPSTDAVDNYYSYGGAYRAIVLGYSVSMVRDGSILAFALETESDRGAAWVVQ